MPFFTRRSRSKPEPEPAATSTDWGSRRRPVANCSACRRALPPYVYFENGGNYCVTCSLTLWETMRFKPAGRREDDITLEELQRLAS